MTATDWARHGLPARWTGRTAFTALHFGPDSVDALLALWTIWRDDAARCGRLYLVADGALRPGAGSALADALSGLWPVEAPGWHSVVVGDDDRVHWLLRFGACRGDHWTHLVLQADAVAGTPQPDTGAPDLGGWTQTSARALSRLAAPGASLVPESCGDAASDACALAALRSAGLVADPPAADRPADTASGMLRYRPRPGVCPPPTRGIGGRDDAHHVLIVGGGLAGCAVAEALAAHGRTSTVVDRHASPAGDASGNPVGLFHGIVTPDDGLHARFNRAGALATQRRVARALVDDGVAGGTSGLLRLQSATLGDRPVDSARTLDDMRATLKRLALPLAYVDAIDADAASGHAGLRVDAPAWWFPGGGWVDPGALARAMLRAAGGRTTWRGGVAVDTLTRVGDVWELRDARGGLIDATRTVVLANAADAQRLLGRPDWMASHITPLRGQLSGIRTDALPRLSLRVPITGSGYAAPALEGTTWFGATSHAHDAEDRVRAEDHASNLRRLSALTGVDTATIAPGSLGGRTAWRWSTNDRLPLVGAVPEPNGSTPSGRLPDQPRHVPRRPGLYLHAALGSRGLTWSVLGGRLLAAVVTGAPLPLPSGLVDAVDPARYVARAARGGRRGGPDEPDRM